MPLGEEWMRDHRLNDENYCANHLGDSFDFAKDAGCYYDAALTCNDEANLGNAELAKENNKNNPHEYKREKNLAAKKHPDKDRYH